MKYENYVRSEMWDTLERAYKDTPCEALNAVWLDVHLHTLMPHMIGYDAGPKLDELEAKENVLDNLDDINDLVIYNYTTYHNLGVMIATCDWSTIDELFKRRWVDELSAIVVNDYIEIRKAVQSNEK